MIATYSFSSTAFRDADVLETRLFYKTHLQGEVHGESLDSIAFVLHAQAAHGEPWDSELAMGENGSAQRGAEQGAESQSEGGANPKHSHSHLFAAIRSPLEMLEKHHCTGLWSFAWISFLVAG